MPNHRKRKLNTSLTINRRNMNFDESCRAFFELLEHPKIKDLLENDTCKTLADKYILASIFVFFRRANMNKNDYNCRNFYLALYLTHDLFEEIEDFKEIIIESFLGSQKQYMKKHFEKFLRDRFALLQKMEFKANVTKQMCDYLIKRAPHRVWERTRDSKHTGVFYKHITCTKCL